jgi:GTP-binding protein
MKVALLLVACLLLRCYGFTNLKIGASSLRLPIRSSLDRPSQSFLGAKKHVSDVDPVATEDAQFQDWVREEEDVAKLEFEREVEAVKADADGEQLPAYMLRLLEEFEADKSQDDGTPSQPVAAEKLPVIAIIGRPNTGKSTIVNKLTGSFKDGAIVHDEPGITRDRTYRTGMWNDYNFQVVDTGGIVFDDTEDVFAERITQQALMALREATVAVMVCDGQLGVNPLDQSLADWLRKKNKDTPIYLAVNKCESSRTGISQAQEFWGLGLGQPWPVSGIHGTGLNDLLDDVTSKHLKKVVNVLKEEAVNVALIGRPNVGKSSLFNRLVGTDRSIVSDVAGTTRDTVDTLIVRPSEKPSDDPRRYRIIDTAGIRKKGKVEYGPEFFMVGRAFKAVKRADVVVMMLDAVDGIVEQDRILAERIGSEGRSCVIALNKWDAVPSKDDKTYLAAIDNIRSNLPSLRWAGVCLISAQTGQRTEKLLESIDLAIKQFTKRVSTAVINEVVNDATMWMAPPTVGSRAGRIYYCMQVSTAPPTFVFFVNDPALFTENYQKFLERKIRESLDFDGTPIKMIWRGKQLRDVGRAANKGLGGIMGLESSQGVVRGRVTGSGTKAPEGRSPGSSGGLLKDRDMRESGGKPRAGGGRARGG